MKLNLDHWFVTENTFSISLMNFYIVIEPKHNGDFMYFPFHVYSDGQELLTFNFYNLEDALNFGESLNRMFTKEEIIDFYASQFMAGKFKGPNIPKTKRRKR